ncbi:hypothetical protein [Pseudosulfitobacter pseudonitzschiae]|uniref:hypothetical protein n=1 Tax=Pseudosulfitobacter pseudonitzschiae TaxID=1402135 RepID=UPI003B767514
MAEIKIEFEGPPRRESLLELADFQKMICKVRYENSPGGSGKLDVSIESPLIRIHGGDMKTFSLSFNAIGPTDPLVFLESLDEGYLNDKVSGLSSREDDLFATIANIRSYVAENSDEMSSGNLITVNKAIDRIATHFDGDHRWPCKALVDSLVRDEIPGFLDDIYHIIGHRKTDENIRFHMDVWPAFLDAFENHLDANFEIFDQIERVMEGKEPVTEEEELEP